METVIVVRDREAAIGEAIVEALTRLSQARPDRAETIGGDWKAIEQALARSDLTPRQRELVRYDLLRLRRAKIAELMGVTPGTLTTYWKVIYARFDLRGADARAQLHQRLFPEINLNELM